MRSITIRNACLSELTSRDSKALCGDTLAQIKRLGNSILRHGLLKPLIVKNSEQGLIVIDGRKRLLALRRLSSEGQLPRDLQRIPYVFVGEHIDFQEQPMSLLSNRDQFMEIGRLRTQGESFEAISDALDAPIAYIQDVLSVAKLSKSLQGSFLCNHISVEQARAFATLPNKNAQDALMQALGPFAKEPEIIKAIYSGETVLTVDDGNVIILPSRAPRTTASLAA